MPKQSLKDPLEARQLRLASIDTLRGIAVLGVISVHCVGAHPTGIALIDMAMKMGRYGVQLFFLASAVTMMMMWEARRGVEKYQIRSFYIRRMARILPMFWLAIPVYIALNGTGPQYYAPNGIGALEIILTTLTQHGWWPTAINSVVPGGWSIAVEMTFYLLFPMLLNLFVGIEKIVAGMVAVALLGILARLAYTSLFLNCYTDFPRELLDVFFLFWFPRQIIFFFCGVVVYHMWRRENPDVGNRLMVAAIVGIASLYIALGRGDTIVAVVLVALVYFFLKHSLSFGLLAALGQRSYSIYLCHFLVLDGVRYFLPVGHARNLIYSFGVWAFVVLVTYLIADFTKRLIEDPGIAVGSRMVTRLNSLGSTQSSKS